MTINLTDAYKQWATRPAEERYTTITQMKEDAYIDMAYSIQQHQPRSSHMQVHCTDDNTLRLETSVNDSYMLNNWTMGQLCSLSKAPKSYLCSLPTSLAADCLTESLRDNRKKTGGMQFFSTQKSNGYILRSITSNKYERIFDYNILSYIEGIQVDGWAPPPGKINSDGTVEPAGLYRSDRSMFAFMINDNNRVDDGTDDGLSRGFFVGNSEVGGGSFFIKTFLYRHICGNHMVMDCSEIKEVRLRHIGRNVKKLAMGSLARDLTIYANQSVLELETKIANAKLKKLGSSAKEVIEFLFRKVGVTQSNATKAWDICLIEEPGLDPTSVWGMIQGVTAVAREEKFTNNRIEIEKASKKLMELV